jgi:hypothetical protein
VVALAIAFPPTLFLPPAVEPGRLQAPPAPGAPARADDPDRPRGAGALPDRQAALPVATPPAVEAAPGIDPFAPPPTPAVFGADAALAAPATPVPGPEPGRPANGDAANASWPALPGAAPALAGHFFYFNQHIKITFYLITGTKLLYTRAFRHPLTVYTAIR